MKPNRPAIRSHLFISLLFWLGLPSMLFAPPPPAWWAQRGATNGQPSDDYAAANIGQLKHFAARTAEELNAKLPGGSGSAVNGLIASWSQPPAPNVTRDDFAAVNLGQLKFVAELFHDRLIAVGFSSQGQYPWTGSTTGSC